MNDDDEMRVAVLLCLRAGMARAEDYAKQLERKAARWPAKQAEDLHAKLRRQRRQVSHYQQAIRLLKAAPMPDEDGTRS